MKLIDMHAHIFLRFGVETEKRIILKTVEKYGIDQIFVSALAGFFSDEEEIDLLNGAVEQFARENPDTVRGYAYICPENKNSLDVLKRGIEEQNMIGAKVWVSEHCDSEKMNPLAEKMIDYNLPVLIHAFKKSTGQCANEGTSENVRRLALRYPELKIIMAHVDGNCYNGVENVRELPNVWVDVSGSTARANALEYTVENLGCDRVLFGSDLTGCSFAIPYGKILEADISEEAREKILYKNTLRLFDRNFKVGDLK